MKNAARGLALLLILALLAGCGIRPAPAGTAVVPGETSSPEPSPTPDPAAALVDALLADMTDGEKVGQLFFVRPDALDPAQSPAAADDSSAPGVKQFTAEIAGMLTRYNVGGVVIFEKNLTSPEQLAGLIGDMQAASKTPLLFAVDEEGGTVSRLGRHPDFPLPWFPSAAEVGAKGDAGAAETMGRTVGEYLAMYGFAMDFAPVADVRTNPDNTVIGDRAFSSDPRAVCTMTDAVARGLLSRGIIPVYKHFPGHGDTDEDSHLGLAVTERTAEELRACEWLPYTENDLTGCAVMVGHIAAPALTGDMTPASLSKTMVTGYLRGELGFDGLVITDSLSMNGITNAWSPGRAAVMALEAGCDVLLMPADLREAYDAVLEAVRSGEIPTARLDESVRRILIYKARIGLLQQ